ncbi:MAG: hypothetical protein ACI9F9_000919 [Candidatus Paceibacteria bacterium]|jgi:hypothetical protein
MLSVEATITLTVPDRRGKAHTRREPGAYTTAMRSFLIGFFAGLVLSALRAPLGLELLQVPANAAGAAMAYRAGALLVVAMGLILGLNSAVESFSPISVLVGAATGYQLHWQTLDSPGPVMVQVVLSLLLVSLLIAGHRGDGDTRPNKARIVVLVLAALGGWFILVKGFPKSHGEAVMVAAAGVISIAIVGRSTGRTQIAIEDPGNTRTASGNLTGIAICGAGMALILEGLARPLRLMGAGLHTDDSLFGTIFFGFAIFGAFAFGRPFLQSKQRLLAFGICSAMSGLGAWAGLRVLANLSTRVGLDIYLHGISARLGETFSSLELDFSQHGMLEYDSFLAAPVLVTSAFFFGTLVSLLRRPMELAALLMGAAAGLVVVPRLLSFQWTSPTAFAGSNCAELAMLGGTVAAAGALFTLATAGSIGSRGRLAGSLFAIAGLALTQLFTPSPVHVLSPWEKREPQPVAVHETPEGLITIESDLEGELFATLNRRPLTVSGPEVREDLRRIQLSWSLLGELPEGKSPRVLFVGQLDTNRALCLSDLGAGSIDRCAAWSDSMAMIEHHLFGEAPMWFAGEILSLSAARAKLERGEYDLVLAPSIRDQAPTTRNLASPAETTAVVWIDAGSGIADESLGESVLVTAPNLTQLVVGLARGPQVESIRRLGQPGTPTFMNPGEPALNLPAMKLLRTRRNRRADLNSGLFADRLALAERTPGVAAGLALHFHGQVASSPFLTPPEKIELSSEAAKLFSQAAAGPEPSMLTRNLIETLAYLYTEQRGIEEIDEFLTAPAERHRPWPALEVALALASLEFLEPQAAVECLERAHSGFPGNSMTLAMQAEAQSQAGDDPAAVRSLDLALQLSPHHAELERRLAIVLRRAGDPRGPDAIRHALEHAPDDAQLLAHKDSGPYRGVPGGYHPLAPGDGHGH